MRSHRPRARVLLAASVCVISTSALASETITYRYDALGRLVATNTTGTVNNGLAVSIGYDPAGNRSNYNVSGSGTTAPSYPSFSVNDASATEGNALVFTVTKSGSASGSFSISYSSANGTAAAGSDYTAVSGTLTFAASETSKTVSVPTTDDTAVESVETLFVNLAGATGGATISDGQGQGSINDNDSTPPSFSIGNASALEGGSLVFTVTKTGTTSSSYSVSFATANGTATSTSDYNAVSGTLTFAANETSKTITVSTKDNFMSENDESFYVNLSNATGGALISDSQGLGTIIDNDSSCSLCR